MKFLRKISDNYAKGETLLEAIIAISIFTMIVGPASALFISSMRTVAMNRNDLIAASLAEEGIEIMRNIRDTNFVKFSPKAEECWNTIPSHDTLVGADGPTNNCDDPSKKIPPGNYILELNPETLDWDLVVGDGDLVAANNEAYRLRLDEQGAGDPADCASATPAPAGCANYTSVYFTPPTTPPELANRGVASPFYRRVSVSYPVPTPAGEFVNGEIMRVDVLVQYRNGSSVRNIERGIILTNQPA